MIPRTLPLLLVMGGWVGGPAQAQDYKPDPGLIYQARKLQFGVTEKRLWTSGGGRQVEGVLDWADDQRVMITGAQRFAVRLADLSAPDVQYIEKARAAFLPEQQALSSLGAPWKTDHRLMTKHVFERLMLQPKPADAAGVPDFTPRPVSALKDAVGLQTVTIGAERRLGYADASRGFSVWTPPPPPVFTVLRPMLGEVVTFEMTYTGSSALKGSDELMGNLKQTSFDPGRFTDAARGKTPDGLELSFTEARGLREVLAREGEDGGFAGPYPFVQLDVTTKGIHASGWKSLKPGQKVKWSGVVTGVFGGAVRGFENTRYWWCLISIQDAAPVK